MRALVLAVLLVSCSTSTTSTDAATPDAPGAVRRVTITNDVFNDPGPGVRLSDGAILPAGSGDLWLAQRSTVSIFAAAPMGVCDLGTFASLDLVPTDASACPGAPGDSVILSGNADGTDQWVGRAWLVFPTTTASRPSYRARVVSDSDVNPSITMTFEYEALP